MSGRLGAAGGGDVFTNVIHTGSTDLLQQALQQIVNDEDEQNRLQQQNNSLMAFLQNSEGSDVPQVIQLSTEQAAALGINFSKLENNVTIEQASDDCGTEYVVQECSAEDVQQSQLSQEETQRLLNELVQSGLLKRKEEVAQEVVFEDWNVQQQQQQQQQQNNHNEHYKQNLQEPNIAMESIAIGENSNHQTGQIEEQTSNFLHIQSNRPDELVQEQSIPKSMEAQRNKNTPQNTIQFSIASSNPQVCSVSESQAQILQRFPVILPSSQFIIEPAQTVLTPMKSIRILPSPTKASNAQTSKNSLLLPKTTILRNMSPQLIKAVPVGTQFLSTANNISTQLLNASQLISKANNGSCSIISGSSGSNRLVNDSLVTTRVSNVPSTTQHLIRQASVQRPGQTQARQRPNQQQYFTPILKANTLASNGITVVRNTPLLNSNAMKQSSTTPVLKSINPSVLKTSLLKNPVAISLPVSKTGNSPVIVTTPVMKTIDPLQPSKSINPSIIRRKMSSTPVSILKPQIKAANNSLIKQNLTSLLSNKKPLELNGGLKPLVTAKLKQSVNSLMKSIKNKPITQKLVTVKQDPIDAVNDSLGSSDNPVQIVQQGDTYHSVNRLTQAQLKVIAEALQQRNQNSANSKEKILYRLSFNDELDLRMLQKADVNSSKNSKRGRPKKGSAKASVVPVKSEEQSESKDDRNKIVARTRSGRLSRPPRHMVRDYKHLNHVDLTQPDLDDSGGGYSDYTTSNGVGATRKFSQEDEGPNQRTELLAGVEMPKRKVPDISKCPTCNKVYLGRSRIAKHFEMNPDHGSLDSVEAELKQTTPHDSLKRKGKKRGPWAYTTPEAKSERRQLKLREAMSACESSEIAKVAAKPVVSSLSLFDLLILKSENNVRTFLSEIKQLVERVREKTSTMLTAVGNENDDQVVDLNEELLCDVLELNSGFYRVNEPLVTEEAETESSTEPPLKMQKTDDHFEEAKENVEESGYSESSNFSVCDLFNERRSESQTKSSCPEVLSALTLVPRNSYTNHESEASSKSSSTPKGVLSSGVEINTTDTPGFQKLSINAETRANLNFVKEGAFTKLGDSLEPVCNDVFTKFNGNFNQSKMKGMQRTFIKLEPTEEGFIKLENGMIGGFHEEMEDFGKIQSNGFHFVSSSISDNFNGKGFRKLVPKAMTANEASVLRHENFEIMDSSSSNHEVNENSIQITTSSNSNSSISDATHIFESTDSLDISKMTNYDHIAHLDMLNESGAIDKNLMMDEKLVEHLQLVNSSNINIVDELVSERLKSVMPDGMLENDLMHHNGSLDTDLDFEELSEEFNRNTRS
ncbi:uncharacterized protein LOC106637311 isoform X2 [Copidosoma floridanum]|uniref:uncharacterized protein LOC106637311 isoform X2 n=1 Tax=Copidosoma floridanum TaxID=29053 RepID=UPI0006C9D3A5|nr:uncharacterized protein LOC106637311 isoform X2 [Copidosoma floridanum]